MSGKCLTRGHKARATRRTQGSSIPPQVLSMRCCYVTSGREVSKLVLFFFLLKEKQRKCSLKKERKEVRDEDKTMMTKSGEWNELATM